MTHFRKRRALAFWYNTALITFAGIAVGLTWTIMNSGFTTSEVVKETLEESVKQASNNLQVIGKMAGTAEVTNNKVTATATPVTATTQGVVDMSPNKVKVTYTLIKDGSYRITYDNIYAGLIADESYNSMRDALVAAKERGLISVNPQTDQQKPYTTTAFLYWIINQDSDGNVQNNEIASLVIVYADKDRPSTGEYLQIQVVEHDGVVLNVERIVPDISTSILDFGGKVKDST
jgi:flagellin FlaB